MFDNHKPENILKILVSNDDGIHSQGIYELVQELKKVGDVTVVAPSSEQSAVGHAITMKIPLRIKEVYRRGEFFGYAVDGTPADCVKIGMRNIIKDVPDVVISGINHGSNTAINIIYSGTVSAAREAAIMDIPAIAVSVTSHQVKNFSYAAKFAANLAKLLIAKDLPKGTLLNVNVPDILENEIKGVKLTKQGKSKWLETYEERIDPFGNKYFWLTGELNVTDTDENMDHKAVLNNFVSVTPIHFDLTDYETYSEMQNWNISELDSVSKSSDN